MYAISATIRNNTYLVGKYKPVRKLPNTSTLEPGQRSKITCSILFTTRILKTCSSCDGHMYVKKSSISSCNLNKTYSYSIYNTILQEISILICSETQFLFLSFPFNIHVLGVQTVISWDSINLFATVNMLIHQGWDQIFPRKRKPKESLKKL